MMLWQKGPLQSLGCITRGVPSKSRDVIFTSVYGIDETGILHPVLGSTFENRCGKIGESVEKSHKKIFEGLQ